MRCQMELFHSQAGCTGAGPQERWELSREVPAEARGVDGLSGEDHAESEHVARDWRQPKGQTKEKAGQGGWNRSQRGRKPEKIIVEAKSRVSPRHQRYTLPLDKLKEANRVASLGKADGSESGGRVVVTGNCLEEAAVKGLGGGTEHSCRSRPSHHPRRDKGRGWALSTCSPTWLMTRIP